MKCPLRDESEVRQACEARRNKARRGDNMVICQGGGQMERTGGFFCLQLGNCDLTDVDGRESFQR